MSHHDPNESHHPLNILENVSFGEGIDLALGLTASVLSADQLVKLGHTKNHTAQHLIKGGLTAGLATAAFAMMAREHREKHEKQHKKEPRRRRSLAERPRPLFHEAYESSDDERDNRTMGFVRPRPSRRSSSTHSTYSEHFRKQDPASSRSPTSAPPRRRALSHSPARDRSFAESHPNLVKFAEAVIDTLREDRR